jgi:Zn-dependent M28 family amino/carboxypeptidase
MGARVGAAVLAVACACHGAVEDRPALACGQETPATLGRCVEEARIAQGLSVIAGSNRSSGSAHWADVRKLLVAELDALGYEVEEQEVVTTSSDGAEQFVGANVVGRLPGTVSPEEIHLSAHYDSIRDDCSGADDNASGSAGVLEAARVLALGRHARTLVVALWDHHEPVIKTDADGKPYNHRAALRGSASYVERAVGRGQAIAAAIVLEMIAFRSTAPDSQATASLDGLYPSEYQKLKANQFRGDFVAITYTDTTAAAAATLAHHIEQNDVPTISLPVPAAQWDLDVYRDLRRSDHATYWAAGIPAAMATDTANLRNPHYHCGEGDDAFATLDVAFAASITRGVVSAVAQLLDGS